MLERIALLIRSKMATIISATLLTTRNIEAISDRVGLYDYELVIKV